MADPWAEHDEGACEESFVRAVGMSRSALIREAFRLEWLTVGWLVIESVVAVVSGLVAGRRPGGVVC